MEDFKFKKGYRSGNLVVVDSFIGGKENDIKMYKLKCMCGTLVDIYINENNLSSDKFVKCPCCDNAIRPKLMENIGNKHGDISVIGLYLGYMDHCSDGSYMLKNGYMLKCSCGKMYSVSYSAYVKNSEKYSSCGCKKYIELINTKINRLTILEVIHNKDKGGRYEFRCKCDCGNECIVPAHNLLNKYKPTKSCGCLNIEITVQRSRTHGLHGTRIYNIWGQMRRRCYDTKSKKYPSYGGRGITICDEWKDDVIAFRDWALANGYRDDYTLERIDVNGSYCPENCKWIPAYEQAWNKTNTIRTTDGESVAALCRNNNFSITRMYYELNSCTPDEFVERHNLKNRDIED